MDEYSLGLLRQMQPSSSPQHSCRKRLGSEDVGTPRLCSGWGRAAQSEGPARCVRTRVNSHRKHSMSQYVRDSTPDSFPSELGHPHLHHVPSFPCKLQGEKTPPHREGGAVLSFYLEKVSTGCHEKCKSLSFQGRVRWPDRRMRKKR